VKVKEYILEKLVEKDIDTCFYVNGGAIAPLIDQISHDERFHVYACLHEASAAYAAEGFTRRSGRSAVVLVTSGPGGTNALTGLNCCWCDSIPVLFISGQVSRNQLIGSRKIRQRGVQETNIIKLAGSISKFATRLETPENIGCLDEALYMMTDGRAGPVWIDICVDCFSQDVELEPPISLVSLPSMQLDPISSLANRTISELVERSNRPVVIAGIALRHSLQILDIVSKAEIPVVSTWAGQPYVSGTKRYIGNLGLFGDRCGNYAVQKADLIVAIGTSLNISHTGYDSKSFAANASIIHIDIDKGELTKDNYHDNYHGINLDIRDNESSLAICRLLEKIRVDGQWAAHLCSKASYTAIKENTSEHRKAGFVNSYDLIDVVSMSQFEFDIVTDMGTSFTCTHQAFKQTLDRRILTAGGHAPMGWGVAGAIGASIADSERRIVCITGDGGLLMSLQDLRTQTALGLNIINILLDNNGYLTMRQTMKNTFGRLSGCSAESGIINPDFSQYAESVGIRYRYITSIEHFRCSFNELMHDNIKCPFLLHIAMEEDQELKPRLASYLDKDGKREFYPLANMYPHNNACFNAL